MVGGDDAEVIGKGENAEDMGGGVAPDVDRSSSRRKHRAVFGGFASGSSWRNRKGFYGDGRSFLFSFDSRDSSSSTMDSRQSRGDDQVRTYTWSGADRSFMTSGEGAGVGMGSGGQSGSFGFFVQSDLRKGTTGACETFNNDPLMSPSTSEAGSSGSGGGTVFDVISIEVWGFRHARRLRKDSSTRTVL